MSVELVENVFTPDEFQIVYNSIVNEKNKNSYSIEKHFWSKALTNVSVGNVNTLILESQVSKMITDKFEKYLKPGEAFISAQYYEWNPLSQINWHNDANKKGAITIYLNEVWNGNWGGYFCWTSDLRHESGNFIIPSFNTALVIRDNPHHHVSLINPYAPVRRTLQIWIVDARDLPAS